MEKWMVLAKRADFNAIAQHFHIDPVIARVIRNRDIVGDEAIEQYLHGGLELLEDPYHLSGMEKAVRILRDKIDEKKKIRIIGDYDIDGIMASYILKRGLTRLGADVDIRIPDRVRDGYGINDDMVREASTDGVNTILTCDNGIAAVHQTDLAHMLGMTMIITDHHEVLEVPGADAVVDPSQPDDVYQNKNLCGAGVAWKLLKAMGADPDNELMPYVAFATVGDIVDLVGENRVIVKEGLKMLRKTDNLGLKALAEVQNVDLEKLSTYHIGFILGPCLNACGRLSTADRAVSLLEASSETMAKKQAEEIKALNDRRKEMTQEGVERAVAEIEKNGYARDRVMVVYVPSVHESVAGIIAGRIREKYGHPTFILTDGAECIKGSGRSIEAYSMFGELTKVRDCLLKYGGHPMAAGLSIAADRVDEFRERINEVCTLTDDDLVQRVRIDVPMPISYVNEELIQEIAMLEPFGKGNERPVFAQKHVYFEHPRLFGAEHNLLKCRVRSMILGGDAEPNRPGFQAMVEGPSFDAVCFKDAEKLYHRILKKPDLSIIYEPQINEYMGRRRVQIVIRRFQ